MGLSSIINTKWYDVDL